MEYDSFVKQLYDLVTHIGLKTDSSRVIVSWNWILINQLNYEKEKIEGKCDTNVTKCSVGQTPIRLVILLQVITLKTNA